MAEGVFLDTAGLIALLNRDDFHHESAHQLFGSFGSTARHLVTTNLVLAELGNSLARTALREDVVWLIRQLHKHPGSEVIHIDASQFDAGVDLYLHRSDKTWGLIDCISFVVMKSEGLADAFTSDKHFKQAGFQLLLI